MLSPGPIVELRSLVFPAGAIKRQSSNLTSEKAGYQARTSSLARLRDSRGPLAEHIQVVEAMFWRSSLRRLTSIRVSLRRRLSSESMREVKSGFQRLLKLSALEAHLRGLLELFCAASSLFGIGKYALFCRSIRLNPCARCSQREMLA